MGYVLAAAQGPKGIILLVAGSIVDETPTGQAIAEYQQYLGEAIAKRVENRELDDIGDDYLIGGGTFMAGVIVGRDCRGSAVVQKELRSLVKVQALWAVWTTKRLPMGKLTMPLRVVLPLMVRMH